MPTTQKLLEERAEALQSLRDALLRLDGADADTVRETAARAAGGRVGPEYIQALYLSQIAQVLADQQRRIAALERAKPAKDTGKRQAS
jgi:hypothetical protein